MAAALITGLAACTYAPTTSPAPRPPEPSSTGAAGAPTAGVTPPAPSAPPTTSVPPAAGVRAFPGAEGFGADATGGRGGAVCTVTSRARAGAGSIAACLTTPGPVTIVFAVGGVFAGPVEITRADVTLAGQTAPGGVTIAGGLVCDNVYEPGSDCRNLVVRHVRLRAAVDDGLRLGGTRDVIIDHASIGAAHDELVEISRSHRITVQHSHLAEPVGDHYRWGGVLLNYSTRERPLDEITLHHNVWNGVAGRLPEISCEENDDAPGSNCAGHTIHLELASNLLFDVGDPIWHNRCVGTNEGNDCAPGPRDVRLVLSLVDNVLVRRGDADDDAPLIEPGVARADGSVVFARGNRVCRGAACVDAAPPGRLAAARPALPAVTTTVAAALPAELAAEVGAWPRDPMDLRLLGYLAGAPGSVDRRPRAWRDEAGVDHRDALAPAAGADAAGPIDGDGDGMPDAWERAHGTDPAVAAPWATGVAASGTVVGCTPGYADLECYLHERATTR
ncbi:MAG: hypothetical protein R2939_15945 [Kofleriaceae bacterium]